MLPLRYGIKEVKFINVYVKKTNLFSMQFKIGIRNG